MSPKRRYPQSVKGLWRYRRRWPNSVAHKAQGEFFLRHRGTAAVKARGTWAKADGTPYKSGTRLGNPNGAAALRRAAKGNGAAVESIKGNADAFAQDLAPVIDRLRSQGLASLPQLARGLNEGGFATPRGGSWHPSSVKNLLARLAA